MTQKKPYFLEEIKCAGEVKKRLLCFHGLNQNPLALKALLRDLSAQGFHVFLLHLPGHNKGSVLGGKKKVMCACQESIDLIVKSHGPIDAFLGYSYGGLLATVLAESISVEKLVLLAPALKLRFYTHMIKLVLPLMKRIHSIPLGKIQYERHYRYHNKGVPRSIYKGFFSIYEDYIKNYSHKKQTNKGIVFCHPKDELIHYKALKKFVRDQTSWEFFELSNKGAEFSNYNHLCFDEVTLGSENYNFLQKKIIHFILS